MKLTYKTVRILEYIFKPIHFNKQNKLHNISIHSNNIKIYGMYHIYCSNSWKDLFQEQINSLKKSHLLDQTTKLFISIITKDQEDITFIKSFDKHRKFQIINIAKDAKKFEFPALEYIKSLSTQEDFLIYYFHTKGVSINSQNYKNYSKYHTKLTQLKRNSDYWRKMMEYWNFSKYNIAINALNSGYDTYGAYIYKCKEYSYYTGNFWWAKSSYIAEKMPTFNEEEKRNRYKAETWILSQSNKCYCPFYCISELYACPMYASIYKSNKITLNKEYIIFLLNHYRYCFYKLLAKTHIID